MIRNLSLLNLFSVILMIIVSYYSQVLRLNNNTIGSVSDEYIHMFTPADYAFSIWGLIYVALIAYCIFQLYTAFFGEDETEIIEKTGPWFAMANLSNTAWIIAWLYEETWLSVILIFTSLLCLVIVIIKTNMERWDASLKIIAFTWWPICFYAGWITVAAISNVAAYLTKTGWRGWIFSEQQWTIIMLAVATAINLLIVYKRNMREFALVGVWALVAVYLRHSGGNSAVAYTALGGAIIIFIYISYHGYMNRKSSPIHQLVKGRGKEYPADS